MSFNLSQDTIVAPITPPGRGPVVVLRLSGPDVRTVLGKISPRAPHILEHPREAHYAQLFGRSRQVLDRSLFLYFPAPKSFTGEDCLEIGIHGSSYIQKELLATLASEGVRMARPGEFSERAFLNGKLDLSQVEAVADLINSETEVQARVASEQLEGKLSQALSQLGEPLRNLLAEIEAYIDFPDEDIEPLTQAAWIKEIEAISTVVQRYCDSFQQGRLCREGALVVLAGLPNAGKSSLLNRLLGEERAIVTPIPGTTRDSIEELCSISGYAVRLCDTAGLLDESQKRTPDEVEALGIERSWKKLQQSELVLYVLDASTSFDSQFRTLGVFEKIQKHAKNLMIVANKSDLCEEERILEKLSSLLQQSKEQLQENVRFVSAITGEGLRLLREKIAERVFRGEMGSTDLLISNERHHRALLQSRIELQESIQAIGSGQPPEIVAFHIRHGLSALSDIIGVTYTDDILGRIFSKFCIGK